MEGMESLTSLPLRPPRRPWQRPGSLGHPDNLQHTDLISPSDLGLIPVTPSTLTWCAPRRYIFPRYLGTGNPGEGSVILLAVSGA